MPVVRVLSGNYFITLRAQSIPRNHTPRKRAPGVQFAIYSHGFETEILPMTAAPSNVRPAPDRVLVQMTDYVDSYCVKSELALETARLALVDTLGCGFEALSFPDCTSLLGPVVPGTVVPNGARVPGTPYVLDPERATFNMGVLNRWLDFNDAFYGATVIHPSDTFSAILA